MQYYILEYSTIFLNLLAWIVLAILSGLFVDQVILRFLKKLSLKTKNEVDDIIIHEVKGKSIPIFVITAIYYVLITSELQDNLKIIFNKIFVICLVFLVTLIVAKVISKLVQILNKDNNSIIPTSSIITNIINIIIIIIGILIILQTLGISITPILTALGVGGLAVALALQDTLSNLFAGIQIIVSKKLNLEDYVKLDNEDSGYITDITWRYTTVRTLQNNIMVIPNAKLASAIITNYYLPEKEVTVVMQVGVSYNSNLQKVEEVTIETGREVMNEVAEGVKGFEPLVRYHTFADFSVVFNVVLRSREFADQSVVKHEFVKRLHEKYKKEGIEIPFPIQMVKLEDRAKKPC